MKFAPAISYQMAPDFSLGAAVRIDYATLDMGAGSSPGFGYGFQLGSLWRPSRNVSLGLSYTSPQKVTHDDVIAQPTMTGGIARFDLALEAPQSLGGGIAWEGMDNRLVPRAEAKWINWADAEGYRDFDWSDQMVYAVGMQYKVVRDQLTLRLGYNYDENPVEAHHGWNGAFTPQGPADVTMVQGIPFPTYYYETFRIVGFPAIVEHHVTCGFTYRLGERTTLNLAYLKALENDIVETGIGPAGTPVTFRSTLEEDSFEFSFAWRF